MGRSEEDDVLAKRITDGEFADGVSFATLELQLVGAVPSVKAYLNYALLARCARAVMLLAAFAGLIAPFRNPRDVPSRDNLPGFRGDELHVISLICFSLAVIGMVWVLVLWWRAGRPRAVGWCWSALVTAVSSGLAIWLFPRFMAEGSYLNVSVFMWMAGAAGLVVFILLAGFSEKRTWSEVERERIHDRLLSLSQSHQSELLVRRNQTVGVLRDRGLVTEELFNQVTAEPLGAWLLTR